MAQAEFRRRAAILAIMLVVYLLVVHVPYNFTGFVSLHLLFGFGWPLGVSAIFAYAYLFGPAVLLFLALCLWPGRLASKLAEGAQVLAAACILVAILDLGIAPLLGGMFSPEAASQIQFLIALSVLGWQALVFFWARQLRRTPSGSATMTLIGWMAAVPVIAIVAWSILAGIAAATQAIRIAGDRPYCIATTREAVSTENYGVIRALEALRGIRLYTNATGYKSTSRWYFHAVLIVERKPGKKEYWNWSIRGMSFDRPKKPQLLTAKIDNACQPGPRFLSRLAWFSSEKDRFERAIDEYTEAIALAPRTTRSFSKRRKAYFEARLYSIRGRAYLEKGKYDRAIADFTKIIEIDPLNVRAYKDRRLSHLRKGDVDRAAAEERKIGEVKRRNDAIGANRLGVFSAKNGKLEHAILHFDRAITKEPHYVEAYYNRALAYQLLGQHAKAEADFAKVEELKR